MRLKHNPEEGNLGFQIAPMIDVVFVIMLFFMVMAGAVKVEKELNIKLPGTAQTDSPVDFVDEQIISIAEDGQVSLNDDEMGTADDHDLNQLRATLIRLKAASDAANSKTVVTIVSAEQAKYARTIDVLDALSVAKVENVTFTVSDDQP